MMILAFPDYLKQAGVLADHLQIPVAEIHLHRFPDQESFIEIPEPLPEHVVVCRSLNQPNDKLIELLLCAVKARELGVKRLTLVAPYLCYMRQDFANRPGVAVSQRIIGRFLAELFDDVLTVDPHLHRISSLAEAIPCRHPVVISAAEAISRFLGQQFKNAILLGPDRESEQWVAAIAENIGFSYGVAEKNRLGDTQVTLTLPSLDFSGQTVVIIDDMASTGRTLAKAAALLQKRGAACVFAIVTHALFCGDAENKIKEAGVKAIWSTDSIDHPSAVIELGRLLADALIGLQGSH